MPHQLRAKMAWAALLPLLAMASSAKAAVIEVAPVTVEMTQGVTSSTIMVTNHSAERTAVQVRAFAWSQTATADKLTRTDDVILSPPIFQLGEGETQTVRIMLRRPLGTSEASYRLLLDELPSPQAARAVQFALRLSLPVFVEYGRNTTDLVWRLDVHGENGPELRVLNRGTRRDRLLNLVLGLANGTTVKIDNLPNPYVLPGVERQWHVPPGSAAVLRNITATRVKGIDDNGPVDVSVPVSH